VITYIRFSGSFEGRSSTYNPGQSSAHEQAEPHEPTSATSGILPPPGKHGWVGGGAVATTASNQSFREILPLPGHCVAGHLFSSSDCHSGWTGARVKGSCGMRRGAGRTWQSSRYRDGFIYSPPPCICSLLSPLVAFFEVLFLGSMHFLFGQFNHFTLFLETDKCCTS
jgi:hypothetical protein